MWFGLVWFILVSFGLVQFGSVEFILLWFGLIWFGLVGNEKVLVQNQGWFETEQVLMVSMSKRVKKFWTKGFLALIDVKQPLYHPIWCWEGSRAKSSHLELVWKLSEFHANNHDILTTIYFRHLRETTKNEPKMILGRFECKTTSFCFGIHLRPIFVLGVHDPLRHENQ